MLKGNLPFWLDGEESEDNGRLDHENGDVGKRTADDHA